MLGFLIFAAALFGLPFLFVAYKLKRAERNEYMNEVKEGPLPEKPIVFAWSAWGGIFYKYHLYLIDFGGMFCC